jgi:hypothetical protein
LGENLVIFVHSFLLPDFYSLDSLEPRQGYSISVLMKRGCWRGLRRCEEKMLWPMKKSWIWWTDFVLKSFISSELTVVKCVGKFARILQRINGAGKAFESKFHMATKRSNSRR